MVKPLSRRTGRSWAPGALVIGALVLCPGCVERLLQLRSDPPGADVYVNGKRVGATPLDHPFVFYGTFDIAYRSRDHFSHQRLERVLPPWYEFPPLDFIAENLIPFKIQDHRLIRCTLTPVRPLEGEEIEREKAAAMKRIEELQEKLPPPSPEPAKIP